MQYLCSAMCVSDDTSYSSSSEDEADEAAKYRMKKVLSISNPPRALAVIFFYTGDDFCVYSCVL